MKKVSIISPVFENVTRVRQTMIELGDMFKNRYDFEVLYYHSAPLPEGVKTDGSFIFLDIQKGQSFDDCVTDGFERAKGNCVVVANLDNINYKDYILKLLVEWEKNAQVVLIKKRIEKPNIFEKIGRFFGKLFGKISDLLLSIVGLNKDFRGMRDFQLFSENVVEVIKEFPEKNYYLRNFDCWVDYRVTILWTEKATKVKRHERVWTKNFALFLSSFAFFLALLLTVIFTVELVDLSKRSTYLILGIGLMVVSVIFGVYNLYKWFVFRKTRLVSKKKKQTEDDSYWLKMISLTNIVISEVLWIIMMLNLQKNWWNTVVKLGQRKRFWLNFHFVQKTWLRKLLKKFTKKTHIPFLELLTVNLKGKFCLA